MRRYATAGVCPKTIDVDTDGNTIAEVRVNGGCKGQAQALPALLRGMCVDDAISRLRGLQCRNGTSCADQIARILEQERVRKSENRKTKRRSNGSG